MEVSCLEVNGHFVPFKIRSLLGYLFELCADRGLASDDEDVTEALKNSSLMEEVGEDALTMPTVDLDISSTVSVSAPDLTASPPLPRRKPKPMPHRSNHHPDSCGCTLCTNCLLVKQQCLLAELRADYMKVGPLCGIYNQTLLCFHFTTSWQIRLTVDNYNAEVFCNVRHKNCK